MSRAEALTLALAPIDADDRHQVDADIAAMFHGFRAMRHQQGDDAMATIGITRHVLGDFPTWAIAKGCLQIARGRAGLDRRFAPNDSELYDVVDAIVRPYRIKLATARALLAAPVEPPRERGVPDASRLRIGAPSRGDHVKRVLADLAARRAAREMAEASSP